MDKKELEVLLAPFQEQCANVGIPISRMCLEEAYPGDASTSYILQVKADWVDNMVCDEAIDRLYDILFDKCDETVRKNIFYIQILDSKSELHCERPL